MARGRPREMAGISAAVRELAAESGISERHAWRLARQRGATVGTHDRQATSCQRQSLRTHRLQQCSVLPCGRQNCKQLGQEILDTIRAGDVKLSKRDDLRLARVQPDALVHAGKEIKDTTIYTQVRKIVREACHKEAKGKRAQMQELLR